MKHLNPDSVSRAFRYYGDAVSRWHTLDEEEAGFHEMARVLLEGSEIACDAQIVGDLGQRFVNYFALYHVLLEIRELLAEIRGLGLTQGIVSNWPPSLINFLKYHDLNDEFSVVVGSGEAGICKPDPALFQTALLKLEVQSQEAVYVGNNLDLDIIPARALGAQTLHFDPRRKYESVADAHDIVSLRERLLEMLNKV